MDVLRFLVIGLLAGWILGKATRGHGYGLLGNMAVGAIGSIVGWFVFGFLGLATVNLAGELVQAVIGTVVFFFLARLLMPSRRKKVRHTEGDE